MASFGITPNSITRRKDAEADLLAETVSGVIAGLICFVLATIITLPIPLGHVSPGTAICLLALGLTQRMTRAFHIYCRAPSSEIGTSPAAHATSAKVW